MVSRTVFIDVPPLGTGKPAETLARMLRQRLASAVSATIVPQKFRAIEK
jgi:hypothetical protein